VAVNKPSNQQVAQ